MVHSPFFNCDHGRLPIRVQSQATLGSHLDRRVKYGLPSLQGHCGGLQQNESQREIPHCMLRYRWRFQEIVCGSNRYCRASRPISTIEIQECQAQHIAYIELPVAFDTLSLVVNAKNTFAGCLSVNEPQRMWEPAAEHTITTWRQIRPSFPATRWCCSAQAKTPELSMTSHWP